jgi:hypothetical protein
MILALSYASNQLLLALMAYNAQFSCTSSLHDEAVVHQTLI